MLNKLTLFCSLKEGFCNEIVVELSSASYIPWYVFDLIPVVFHFFGVALIINWEIKVFVVTWHYLERHVSLFSAVTGYNLL